MIVNNITDNTITKDIIVSIKMFIGINFEVEGFHFFPNASILYPEVAFLEDNHRHLFKICCEIPVTHTERDREFLIEKRRLQKYIHDKYGNPAQFGPMSCESIALELLNAFDCSEVIVSEDGENYSKVKLKKIS